MMKVTDHSGSRKITTYHDFPNKFEAIDWLKKNLYRPTPNSLFPNSYEGSFFQDPTGKISAVGWDC